MKKKRSGKSSKKLDYQKFYRRISRRFFGVDMHNGTIYVISSKKGTVFTMIF